MTEGPATPLPLRAGQLLTQSFGLTAANWRGLLAVAALPAGSFIPYGLMELMWEGMVPADGISALGLSGTILAGALFLLMLILWAIIIIGPAVFVVGWLRLLLLGPGAIGRPVHFRFARRELGTLGYSILLGMMFIGGFVPVFLILFPAMAQLGGAMAMDPAAPFDGHVIGVAVFVMAYMAFMMGLVWPS